MNRELRAPVAANLVAFGRVLRAAGLEVGPGRIADALRGLAAVDVTVSDDFYWALRQTLVARHDELEVFDRAFAAWFLGEAESEPDEKEPSSESEAPSRIADQSSLGDEMPSDEVEPGASLVAGLRDTDFAELTDEEFRRVLRLLEAVARVRPRRVSRRRTADRRGQQLDVRRLIRASLRTGGDPVDRRFRARKVVPRRIVVLCDVSGSMKAYARALLLFVHAVVGSGSGVEVFAFGTRLSRLTTELRLRDPEEALTRAATTAVDWGSGTRIGASLKELNDSYGRRALLRGAVVVIASDGWERDDPELVGRQMARLARSAYAVVWVNPLKGNPEYQPLAGGMRAALPYVDRFLPGHNLRSLEELATVLAGIVRRHAA